MKMIKIELLEDSPTKGITNKDILDTINNLIKNQDKLIQAIFKEMIE